MKKNFLSKLILLAVVAFGFMACEDDDPEKIALYLPVADFSYEIFDMKVVLTDKSENVVSYYWTFGDGETSTEQNPTHIYKEKDKYSVELTVTGENGKTSSKKVTADLSDGSGPAPGEQVNITLDGNFDDWDEVPTNRLASAQLTSHEKNLLALKEVKFCGNEDYVYFYIKAEDAILDVVQFYIDQDNSNETGFIGWTWTDIGSEIMLECRKDDNFSPTVLKYNDANSEGGTAWNWEVATVSGDPIEVSEMVKGQDGIVEFEGSIKREIFPDFGTTIKMGTSILQIVGDDWNDVGVLPGALVDGTKGAPLSVRLPKR